MKLTRSEESIVRAVIEGESNREIAWRHNVTEKTVKFHLTNIYAKLEVQTRAQLIVKFLKTASDDAEFFQLMRELVTQGSWLPVGKKQNGAK